MSARIGFRVSELFGAKVETHGITSSKHFPTMQGITLAFIDHNALIKRPRLCIELNTRKMLDLTTSRNDTSRI
jgi:hypothetical protein